ncbi:hypothetical protein [Microbulbifer sp. ZKSA002]|uniref:hypothetical protein n=1 Tax=Microbulbifer sp. ZKSA002 TaxID=3243388 RepID=UPI004039640A
MFLPKEKGITSFGAYEGTAEQSEILIASECWFSLDQTTSSGRKTAKDLIASGFAYAEGQGVTYFNDCAELDELLGLDEYDKEEAAAIASKVNQHPGRTK